jgi:hypothetical protein
MTALIRLIKRPLLGATTFISNPTLELEQLSLGTYFSGPSNAIEYRYLLNHGVQETIILRHHTSVNFFPVARIQICHWRRWPVAGVAGPSLARH